MKDENPIIVRPAGSLAHAAARRCRYCGAPLFPEFYFCLTCATPYKQPESVLPPSRPAALSEGEIIRRKAPQVWTLFWAYLGTLVVAAIVAMGAFGRQESLQLLVGSAAILITTCVFASMHWQCLLSQFKKIGFFRWEAWAGIAVLAPLLGVNFLWHGFLRSLPGVSDGHSTRSLTEEGLPWGALVFFFCVCPAILEEIAFRGLVQHWLQVVLKPWRAMILASALFTALHFSVLSAPYLFLVGMLLGWTKWKTGSLYPSMAIHFLHNFAVIAWMG